MSSEALPVPVLAHPHWRVVVRPTIFEHERVGSLRELLELVERNAVHFRGWPFPALAPRNNERGQGENWVASWSTFGDHIEYWRFFQSTQLLYLGSIREVSQRGWFEKLRADTRGHLSHLRDFDVDEVPGFFSLTNFIYNITEYFEFAARLSQVGIYDSDVSLTIELKDVENFVLTTDWRRARFNLYRLPVSSLSKTWTIPSAELIAGAAEHAEKAIIWFFERFGWLNVAPEVIRASQMKLISGQA